MEQLDYSDKLRRSMEKEGYSLLSTLAKYTKKRFLKNLDNTKEMLAAYAKGTRFCHVEAYDFCVLANTWPEFARHPQFREYVLSFDLLNSTTASRELRQKFEEWFEENRQLICKNVAEALGVRGMI